MQLPDTMDGLMDKFTIVFPSKSASGDLASSLPGPIGGSQGFPSACTGATDLGPAFCEPTTGMTIKITRSRLMLVESTTRTYFGRNEMGKKITTGRISKAAPGL